MRYIFLSLALVIGLAASARADMLSFKLHYTDASNNELGFRAYRVSPGTRAKVGEVAAGVVDIPVTDEVSVSPCYVVRAYNSIGESLDSNQACAVVPLAPGSTTIVVPPPPAAK